MTSYQHRVCIVLAFLAIFSIWGSTFLAIRLAVETIPPLLLMSLRCLLAGLILFVWARQTGAPSMQISAGHWRSGLIAGCLLFLMCHGSLAWAEQRVPSGEAALLSATTPLWVTVIDWRVGARRKPTWWRLVGLAIGFAGVGLLVSPGSRSGSDVPALASMAIVAGSFAWAAGSVYGRGANLPHDVRLATAVQLLAGAGWLVVAGVLSGEWRTWSTTHFNATSVGALAYLAVFGSVVAFTAYVWLMRVIPAPVVGTYAYVTPIVAVALGAAVGGEPVAATTIVAGFAIVFGVVLTMSDRHGLSARPRPKPASSSQNDGRKTNDREAVNAI